MMEWLREALDEKANSVLELSEGDLDVVIDLEVSRRYEVNPPYVWKIMTEEEELEYLTHEGNPLEEHNPTQVMKIEIGGMYRTMRCMLVPEYDGDRSIVSSSILILDEVGYMPCPSSVMDSIEISLESMIVDFRDTVDLCDRDLPISTGISTDGKYYNYLRAKLEDTIRPQVPVVLTDIVGKADVTLSITIEYDKVSGGTERPTTYINVRRIDNLNNY